MAMLEEAIPKEVGCGGSSATQPLPGERFAPQLQLRLPAGRKVPLVRDLTVGQSSANDVVLRDPCVSRVHCLIEVSGGRVLLRDRGSTNGTWVNGARVSQAELRSGAVVQIGESRLRVAADADQTALLGESPTMRRVREQIVALAPTGLSVLVHGETGTGKELVALALHDLSGRRGGFVPLNCGAIPRELVESELFGHEKGAFTGAVGRRVGVFQEAHGGTLFLDEVAELPLELQPRLLRALETGMIRPVGSTRDLMLDVRVVAATHVDLRMAVRVGRFREDLYYRLVGHQLETPPLRTRGNDVVLLAKRFADELGQSSGGCRLSDDALARLRRHPWPGNVRELRHVIRRAVLLGGPEVRARDLGLDEVPRAPRGTPFEELERDLYQRALQQAGGSRRAAAQALGIPKSTFCDKLNRWNGK
jgi:DNA-binding NtrC family response regulator